MPYLLRNVVVLADFATVSTVEQVVMSRYDASEETLRIPVTTAEVDAMLTARNHQPRARHALAHFLYRVRVTVSQAEADRKENIRTIERLRETRSQMGAPSTLSPVDAVRFASPAEISKIVGQLNSAQLNSLARLVDEARARHVALTKDLGSVRRATNEILKRPDLPAAVRLEFIRLINTLPETPEPVEVPRALEMARSMGRITDDPGEDVVGEDRALPAAEEVTPQWPGAPAPTDSLPQYGPPPPWRPDPSEATPPTGGPTQSTTRDEDR